MSFSDSRNMVAFSSLRMGYDRAVVDRFVAMGNLLHEMRMALTFEGHKLSNPTIKHLTPGFVGLIRSLARCDTEAGIDAIEIVAMKGYRHQMHGVYANPLTWCTGLSVLILIDPFGVANVGDPIRKQVVRDRAGMAWTHATMQQQGV